MSFRLSDRQATTVAAAITILAASVILFAVAALVWLAGSFFREFSGVFLPLATAAVVALVFKPYYEWLEKRMRPTIAVALVFLSMVVPIVLFGWFFGALIVEQVGDMVHKLPKWRENLTAQAQERWPQVQVFFEEHPLGVRIRETVAASQDSILEGLQSLGGRALDWGGVVLRGLGALLGWAVLPVYFAFFLMSDPEKLLEIDEYLPFLKPETRADVAYLIKEFVDILVAFFRGQLLIAFFQGMLFAIGFSIVGLRYGFVLGLVLGFLNIIPYLGSMVGLGVAIPLGYFQQGGGLMTVVAVLVTFTIVQMIEGYVLTPRIMGDRTGLHPMTIIVAIFFWGTALDGLAGMILAIPLTAFLVVFWRLAKERYFRELV